MGYRPETIDYIRLASKLGVGSMDTASARIISLNDETDGEGGDAAAPEMQTAKNTRRVARLAEYASPKEACSACYGSLIYALDRLDEAGLLKPKKKGTLAIGQGYRGRSGAIGIGQCTSCFKKNLGGCGYCWIFKGKLVKYGRYPTLKDGTKFHWIHNVQNAKSGFPAESRS